MKCPACNAREGQTKDKKIVGVYHCGRCEAVYGACFLGESYEFVLPYMADCEEIVPQERQRYYDFTVLGSKGFQRRHGWYDTKTRLIVQIG